MEHDNDDLTRVLGTLAFDLQDQANVEDTLEFIVAGAIRLVPGARWAGISMINGHTIEARVPSHPLVKTLDEMQSTFNEGPCVETLREHHTVLIDDVASDRRWPRFTAAAHEAGVGSILSFQLHVRKNNFGALNLYGSEPFIFDVESQFIGRVLAQHASVAMAASTLDSQFHAAIDRRDLIGQAKGLLMERNGVTGLQAFKMLVSASQDNNVKLVDVARWLVETHDASAVSAPEPRS